MNRDKKPLYRKVNTTARGCHHQSGQDFKHERHTKKGEQLNKQSVKMKRGVERGLDYTPLYMFLLSKVGKKWDDVYSEAISRLDKSEPIFYIVAKNENDKKDVVRCGDKARYSGLFVDDDGLLQIVDPTMTNEKLYPSCPCCTTTFNGKPLSKTYEDHTKYNIPQT